MSMGIGGFCSKVLEDDAEVIYEYSSYNLNDSEHRDDKRITDGFITIEKSALPEPEIYEKIKRLPNGRKTLIVKRIPRDLSVDKLISDGKIHIENCTNTWKTAGGYDIIVLRLCRKLIYEYQLSAEFPEKISYTT